MFGKLKPSAAILNRKSDTGKKKSMALIRLSSFLPQSQKTPMWLLVALTCFLLQTLIPNGYMPGNLSSGESALVFCGDTAFLNPDEPDISELLDDLQPKDHGLGHGDFPHSNTPHDGAFSDFSHCVFSIGGQTAEAPRVFLFYDKLVARAYERIPLRTAVSPIRPSHIRPLLRAPPLRFS